MPSPNIGGILSQMYVNNVIDLIFISYFDCCFFSSIFSTISANWKPIAHLQNAANHLVNGVQNVISGVSNGYPNSNNLYSDATHGTHHTNGIITQALAMANASAQKVIEASRNVTQNAHHFLGHTVDKLTGGRNNNIINAGLNTVVDTSNAITQGVQHLAAHTINTVVGGAKNVFGRVGGMITNRCTHNCY